MRDALTENGTSKADQDVILAEPRPDLIRTSPYKSALPSTPSVMATDYCTMSPEGWGLANFSTACSFHDGCYSRRSNVNRLDCDRQFLNSLIAECYRVYGANTLPTTTSCVNVAGIYYGTVRAVGSSRYVGNGLNN